MGATFAARGNKVSRDDALRYLLSALIISVSAFVFYYGHTRQLFVQTAVLACGVLSILFASLYFVLKDAPEDSPQFLRAVSIISLVMASLSVATLIFLIYIRNVASDPNMYTVDEVYHAAMVEHKQRFEIYDHRRRRGEPFKWNIYSN